MSPMQITRSDGDFRSLEQYFSVLSQRAQPALAWYGTGQDRVELSGRVLENWVAKTAHMLVEEFELGPGERVALALEGHWRAVAVGLAAVRVGAELVPASSPAELWIGFEAPSTSVAAEEVLLVDRAPLATSWSGTLPAGAVDYCAEVRSFDDVFSPLEPVEPEAVLARGEGGETTVRDWLALAQEQAARVRAADRPATAEPAAAEPVGLGELARWAGTVGAGGTVVLVDADRWARPDQRAAILAEQQALPA